MVSPIVPIIVSTNGLIAKSEQHMGRFSLGSWIRGLIKKALHLDTARIVRRILFLELSPPVAWTLFLISVAVLYIFNVDIFKTFLTIVLDAGSLV